MAPVHTYYRFRWVECQLGYLRFCLPGRIRHALEELPDTLYATYERALKGLNKANWEVAHRLFQLVAVASRPLGVEELAQFLGFDFTTESIPKFRRDWLLEDPVDAVLSTTSSLLAIVDVGDSQVIQFSHFSVKEFLTSPRLAGASDIVRRYHISMTAAHTLAAQACLGMLLHLEKKVTAVDLEQFYLADYAAEHWVDHARFEDVFREVEDGMKLLFNPTKPHFAIWVWVHDLEDRYWHRGKRGKSPSEPRGSPLQYAALCGLDVIVKFLVVKHGQDVNSRGFDHQSTALHLASRRGHVKVVRALLDNGADGESRDKRKSTPLHLASNYGHAGVVRALLERGVDVTAEDDQEFTPPALAIRGGHTEVTKTFLEFGVGGIAEDVKKWPQFHRALFEGDIEVICTLLERGVDLTEEVDDFTPLFAALVGGHTEAVRMLLEHNVDINVDGVNTALHIASTTGSVEIVRILLEHGLDATARGMDGKTSLHMASECGHVEVAGLLLAYGAGVTGKDDDGCTPLHLASIHGHVEFANHLLKHGADATARENARWTPLHFAAQFGHAELARLLLEHGADATAQTDDGATPIRLASDQGDTEIAHVFLKYRTYTIAQEEDGLAQLRFASRSERKEVPRPLLEGDVIATARTDDGRIPSDMALEQNCEEFARISLEHPVGEKVQEKRLPRRNTRLEQGPSTFALNDGHVLPPPPKFPTPQLPGGYSPTDVITESPKPAGWCDRAGR